MKSWFGKKIGEGKEHIVYYSGGKYVYKVYVPITRGLKVFREVWDYIIGRNSIPYQMPVYLIGFTYACNRICPVFIQKKVEPAPANYYDLMTDDMYAYRDVRRENLGIYKGKLVAIDIKV